MTVLERTYYAGDLTLTPRRVQLPEPQIKTII